MGISHDAYVAYGVRVDINPYLFDDAGDDVQMQVDKALSVPTVKEACPDVGHLEAGAYDQDSFFLVTKCESAGYEPQFVADLAASSEADEASWERQILHLVSVMGWSDRVDETKCGWFVICDES